MSLDYKHPQITKAVDWKPFPGLQTEILKRSEDLILTGGSRGGFKTETGLAMMANPCYVDNPQFRGLVIRKNTDDLSDWIFRARKFYDGIGQISGRPPVIHWRGGGETVLGHWKDQRTLQKYIGQEFHFMNVEELTQTIGSLQEFMLLLGSLRSTVKGLKPQLYSSTNPGGIGHTWTRHFFVDRARLKTVFDKKTKKSLIFIPTTVDDNPAILENDPGYVAYLDGLPEPLRSAWRYGDWDSFEGQFFKTFGTHLKEQPFEIKESDCAGRLYGSLDLGTAHGTSFGLWYLDPKGYAHRIFSYLGTCDSHSEHEDEIYNRIASCEFTHGMFPVSVSHCRSGNVVKKDDLGNVWMPIEEYEKRFKGQITEFELAFDEKRLGCGAMHEAFKFRDGVSFLRYFDTFNTSFETHIIGAVSDDNDPEVYKKTNDVGDDVRDEARYGLVKLYSLKNLIIQRSQMRKASHIVPLNLNKAMNDSYGYINTWSGGLG